MKRYLPQTEDQQFNILTRGTYIAKDSSLARPAIKTKKEYPVWLYIVARVSVLIAAITFIVWGSMLALDGSWDFATFLFIVGILFFIPFILYSRKVNELKKQNLLKKKL